MWAGVLVFYDFAPASSKMKRADDKHMNKETGIIVSELIDVCYWTADVQP